MSFAELDGSPLGTLRRIYSGLGLEGFEAVRPACEAYCRGLHLKGFKKNAHRCASRGGGGGEATGTGAVAAARGACVRAPAAQPNPAPASMQRAECRTAAGRRGCAPLCANIGC